MTRRTGWCERPHIAHTLAEIREPPHDNAHEEQNKNTKIKNKMNLLKMEKMDFTF